MLRSIAALVLVLGALTAGCLEGGAAVVHSWRAEDSYTVDGYFRVPVEEASRALPPGFEPVPFRGEPEYGVLVVSVARDINLTGGGVTFPERVTAAFFVPATGPARYGSTDAVHSVVVASYGPAGLDLEWASSVGEAAYEADVRLRTDSPRVGVRTGDAVILTPHGRIELATTVDRLFTTPIEHPGDGGLALVANGGRVLGAYDGTGGGGDARHGTATLGLDVHAGPLAGLHPQTDGLGLHAFGDPHGWEMWFVPEERLIERASQDA